MDNHYKLEHTLSSMIRRGYVARNPKSREFVLRIKSLVAIRELTQKNKIVEPDEVCKLLAEKFEEIPETQRLTAECASVIGIRGMGKTAATEKLLCIYPQVIHHYLYQGESFTRTQIVWLKIDSPFDGSLKTLCKAFFRALDVILGDTNYYNTLGNNRNSTATMMI